MKTLHHHSHLKPHEIEDIERTILFCRKNSMRGKTVLGWAQVNTPLAYNEYIKHANKNAGILGWFKSLHYKVQCNSNFKKIFEDREKDLYALLEK